MHACVRTLYTHMHAHRHLQRSTATDSLMQLCKRLFRAAALVQTTKKAKFCIVLVLIHQTLVLINPTIVLINQTIVLIHQTICVQIRRCQRPARQHRCSPTAALRFRTLTSHRRSSTVKRTTFSLRGGCLAQTSACVTYALSIVQSRQSHNRSVCGACLLDAWHARFVINSSEHATPLGVFARQRATIAISWSPCSRWRRTLTSS